MNGQPRRAVRVLVLTPLGVGAMNSPRYGPAGLLVSWCGRRVMLDGGAAATPRVRVDAWLVTDERAELMADIRRRCLPLGLMPSVRAWYADGLTLRPMQVEHTSHATVGYLIEVADRRVVWAPEFWRFPSWAAGADLMFADAAGWRRPIRFAGGVGGHAAVIDTAEYGRRLGVVRLVFAHIGRPGIRAIDAGERLPYGEWAVQGRRYRIVVNVGESGPEDPLP
jgi:hypothetical protein